MKESLAWSIVLRRLGRWMALIGVGSVIVRLRLDAGSFRPLAVLLGRGYPSVHCPRAASLSFRTSFQR